MSRSRRKPFVHCAICCSTKKDRQRASRALRRLHRREIRFRDDERFLLSHFRETPHGDNWCWVSDGGAMYCKDEESQILFSRK